MYKEDCTFKEISESDKFTKTSSGSVSLKSGISNLILVNVQVIFYVVPVFWLQTFEYQKHRKSTYLLFLQFSFLRKVKIH